MRAGTLPVLPAKTVQSGSTQCLRELAVHVDKAGSVVSIEGEQHPGLPNGVLKHSFVRNSGRLKHHGHNVMASCGEDTNTWQRKILVGEELHADRSLTMQLEGALVRADSAAKENTALRDSWVRLG